MRVVPIAVTRIYDPGFDVFDDLEFKPEPVSAPEILSEFAGRACYESYHKPNPKTATNQGYLAHILESAHESVLEHSSVSFYVTGVSRNLLLELERHRHISFSVISTRYVDADKMHSVIHPNTPEDFIGQAEAIDTLSHRVADDIYGKCIELGYSKKKAREVARQVLPGNTETRFVVTGNLRAWRDVIKKRYSPYADEEIRLFAQQVLANLKDIAPNCFQDLEL